MSAPTPAPINIVLAGTSGIPGRDILSSLLHHPISSTLHITILKRTATTTATTIPNAPSQPTAPPSTHLQTAHVDFTSAASLATTLTALSPHIVISALNAEPAPTLDGLLLSATITAGEQLRRKVLYVNGFTLDMMHASARRYAEHLAPKVRFAERLSLEAAEGRVEYCTVVNAGFMDYVLVKGYAGVDLGRGKVVLFDGGREKVTGCSLRFVGEVVAEVVRLVVLGRGEEVRNMRIRVAEVEYTGLELLGVVREVTGEEFEVSEVSTEQLVEQGRVISALNWNGEGAAWFGEEGLNFGKDVIKRRTLREIVQTAIEGGVAQFEGIGR